MNCRDNETATHYFKKWYYENGNIKKIQEYSSDSIENGKYLYFYSNGILEDSAQITNGLFCNDRYEYHSNGELFIYSNYYKNKCRNSIDYRRDGNIEYYRAYGYFGDLMFIVSYDSTGLINSYEGHLIYNYFLKDTININKLFDFKMLVATPPNGITKVNVLSFDNDSIIYLPDRLNRIKYSIKPNKNKCIYKLNIAVFTDTVENITITDTLIIKIDTLGKTYYYRSLLDI